MGYLIFIRKLIYMTFMNGNYIGIKSVDKNLSTKNPCPDLEIPANLFLWGMTCA